MVEVVVGVMKIKIYKNVKVPKESLPRRRGRWTSVVDKMKKGDSVLLSREDAESLWQAGMRYRSVRMTRRRITEKSYRVWRI